MTAGVIGGPRVIEGLSGDGILYIVYIVDALAPAWTFTEWRISSTAKETVHVRTDPWRFHKFALCSPSVDS
jgi:hypothetical protein